jgi:hypothetical protein
MSVKVVPNEIMDYNYLDWFLWNNIYLKVWGLNLFFRGGSTDYIGHVWKPHELLIGSDRHYPQNRKIIQITK